MSLSAIIAVLLGVFKFFDQVKWFVELLQKTPAEKHADIIAKIKDASDKADKTGGDTSGYEDVLNS